MNGCLPTEPNTVLAIAIRNAPSYEHHVHGFLLDAWATAAPASGDGPPSSLGAGTGGAQGRRPWGSDRPVQAPPSSPVDELTDDCVQAEKSIQRLVAQADGAARTIEALAFLVWQGTQRCLDCLHAWGGGRTPVCDRCAEAYVQLESLGFGERMREWAS